MGFFNKVKTQASSLGTSIGTMGSKITGDVVTSSKENTKLLAIKAELNSIEGELEVAYKEIGKKYIEHIVKSEQYVEIGVKETLNYIEPKLDRKQELENEAIEIEKTLKDQLVMQEKAIFQKEFDEEKEKLDKALKMDILSESEYNEKLSKAKSKLANFDQIRKIKKQFDMDLITKEEMNIKLSELEGN